MADWSLILARAGLYGMEGLLFGIPLFCLYALRSPTWERFVPIGSWLISIALCAVITNLLGFGLLLSRMAGQPLGSIDLDLALSIIRSAPVGAAFVLRLGATMLTLLLALLLRVTHTGALVTVALLGGFGLGSLAWNGHAAASEGWLAWPHILADIVHLLGMGAWLGGIACLLFISFRRNPDAEHLATALYSLKRFAPVGTIIVALLVLTGLVNGVALLGARFIGLPSISTYPLLLSAKLALFGLMLGLAALHRFRSVPKLEQAASLKDRALALRGMRASLSIEFAAAALILGLVGWLGTLEPSW